MKTLSIFLTLLLITSCGTLTKKDEYIQIDSTPRGLEVLDEDETSLGVTPFVTLSKQKRKSLYYIKGDEDSYAYRCGLDWQNSVVPALLIMPIAIPVTPVISTGFLGIDYLSDNLFSCHNPLHIKPQKSPKPIDKQTKVVVLPLFNGQNHSVQELVDKVDSKIKSKHKFISYVDSLNSFSAHGITEEKFWSLRNIKKQSLLKVINELDATHILVLKNKKGPQFEAQIFDLFTKTPVTKKLSIKSSESYKETDFYSLTKKYLYFLPNSIGIGVLSSSASIDKNFEEASFGYEKHPSDFHWLASMWTFSSVSSPLLFDTWDYDFRFSPHIAFPSFRAKDSDDYYIDVQNYNLSYDFMMTGHMPLGALSFSLGLGMNYLYGEDSLKNDFSSISPLLHINFSYTAFFTERVFFSIATDAYRPLEDKRINDYRISQITTASFSLGYYFPELRSFLR